jgi:hypothetical protein
MCLSLKPPSITDEYDGSDDDDDNGRIISVSKNLLKGHVHSPVHTRKSGAQSHAVVPGMVLLTTGSNKNPNPNAKDGGRAVRPGLA